jgi:hypothetical protein
MHNLWENFLTSGGKYKDKTALEIFRLKLINVMCLIGSINTFPLIIRDLFDQKYNFAFITIIFNIIIISLFVLLRFKPVINAMATVFSIAAGIGGLSYYFSATDKETYRILALPIITVLFMLLKGKKVGLIFSIIYFIPFAISFTLSQLGYISLPYDMNSFLLLSGGYVATVLYLYMNQSLVESTQEEVISKNKQLADSLTEISKEVETRKKAEALATEQSEKLKVQNDELSRMNKMMVDRDLKMVEMKNKITQLEEENKKLKLNN